MAALDLTCLDGIVGLANCACECYADTAPEGYNTASSGLYIADILPIDMAEGADNCNDPDNPWNVLERGSTEGKSMLYKDINAGLMKSNQLTRQPFAGVIGEKKSRETVSLTETYAGLRIWSKNMRGAYLRINKIGGVFDTVGTVTVRIYDQFNTQIGSAVTITTTAGGYATATTSIKLPLWQDGAEDCQYFLSYTVASSPTPRAIRAWCPTCSGLKIPAFSLDNPYTTGNWKREQGWANWLQIAGWQRDSQSEFDILAEETGGSGYSNGLVLEVELSCDPFTSVCLSALDYSDPVALSMAHALRYAMAICTAEKIIRRVEPYRNAQVAAEILAQDIQQWYKDYQTNVEYVTYHANVRGTDCVFCKPQFAMSLGAKLS